MLSESLVASVLGSAKTQTSSTLKDVGICVQELQPASALRSTFKKSSTPPNGLAVTPAHVFAAQREKSVIHVYNRLRGNQEATVPFPERIRSVAVAGGQNGEVMILGTEGGRLILWEVCLSLSYLQWERRSLANVCTRHVLDDKSRPRLPTSSQ
jgi:pre-rRNA-processing protein IPI3